jgi:hypothetical protein
MVLIVNYTLKNRLKDYSPLFDAIKNCGEWWHFMEATWIINTTHSPDAVARHLNNFIDSNLDFLLVCRLSSEHQGWLPKEAWDWLNSKQY